MTTTSAHDANPHWIGDAIPFDEEQFRLRAVEGTYDPHTIGLLRDEIGVEIGWRCLDVGAGAGSVVRWLSRHVGSHGEVVALDMNCRFLTNLPANVRVVEHTLGQPLPDLGRFDLVHHRAVLSYVPERESVIADLVRLLKPGGWMLSEEAVLAVSGEVAVTGGPNEGAARRVYSGLLDLLQAAGTHLRFGLELPRLLVEAGLVDVLHDGIALVTPGGDSPRADVIWPAARALRTQLRDRVGLTDEDIDAGIAALRAPTTWHQLPVVVSAWGRRAS